MPRKIKKSTKSKLSVLFKGLARDPVALAQALLADKELPTRGDETGRSLLHHVAAANNMPCFNLLLAEGADINAKDNEANTPLHMSSWFGNIEISKKLIALGCNTQMRNARRLTAMEMTGGRSKDVLQLVHHADYRAVAQLIDDSGPGCLGRRDADGWTALHVAAAAGWTKGVGLLLSRGAAAAAVDHEGRNAAHLAARFGHADVIELLVRAQPDLAHARTHGKLWTPLTFAVFHDKLAAAVVLINYGANIHARDAQNRTPLHYVMDVEKRALLADVAEMVSAHGRSGAGAGAGAGPGSS